MSIHIDKIRLDGGTQSRAALNDATVSEYAEAMADPDTVFPPITVYFDGKEYWLADGFHRLAAWRLIGRTDIPADIRQGDRRRAILHSVAANAAHGLRRTNDDKRRAVLTLLEDAEWSAWSNREVARRCGVSEGFVRSLRTERSDDHPQERTYTNKHGTEAVMNTSNIGVRETRPTEPARQEAEVGEVADRETAASPATPPTADKDQLEVDPDTAKVMRELAKLTPEGVADEVIGLRAALAENTAATGKLKIENADLKQKLRDFDGDSAETIRRLQKAVDYEKSKAWRATEAQGAAMKQVHALKKRVAELEAMEIPL